MSVRLTDTQLVLLSAASQRDDHCLVPPAGAQLRPARKAVAKLLDAGFVKEIRAGKDMPVWRRDDAADQAFALKLTAAGLKAIEEANEHGEDASPTGDDSEATGSEQVLETSKPEALPQAAADAAPSQPVVPRAGTKISDVIAALEKISGATIDEIVTVTGWLPHTARAALTGLRKRGYEIASDRSDRTRGSVYRVVRAKDEAAAADTAITPAESAEAPDPVLGTEPRARTVRKTGPRTRKAA